MIKNKYIVGESKGPQKNYFLLVSVKEIKNKNDSFNWYVNNYTILYLQPKMTIALGQWATGQDMN